MALVYMDGFDHQNASRYTNTGTVVFETASPRAGGSTAAYKCGNTGATSSQITFPSLPSSTTYYVGFAVRGNVTVGFPVISLLNDTLSANLINITFDTPGSSLVRPLLKSGASGSTLVTSSVTFGMGVWTHIGCAVTIGSSGSGTFYVNGAEQGTFSGVDLRNGGSTSKAAGLTIATPFNGGGWWWLDDLYVLDGSGSSNNTFPGDRSVLNLLPNGAGSATNWTRSTGVNNWDMVNDTSTGGADYVYSSTSVDDLYALANLPASGVYGVDAVQIAGVASRSDATAARNVALLAKSGANYAVGPSIALSTTNTNYYLPLSAAPGGAAWTTALVDAMEIGIRGQDSAGILTPIEPVYGVPAGTTLTALNAGNNPYPANTFTSEVYKINTSGTFTGWRFDHRVEVHSGDVQFVNCRFAGAPGTSTGDVALMAVVVSGTGTATATNCTFKPSDPYDGIDGLRGCRMTISGCDITETVDGMQLWSGGDVTIQDTWVHDLLFYNNNSHSPPVTGTHNDGAQISSASNYTFTNNKFTGDMNTAPIFVTQALGATSNVHIVGNTFDVSGNGADVNVYDVAGAGPITGLWIKDNVFKHDTHKYQMLVSGRTKNHASTVISGNVWADGATPPPTVATGA